MPLLRPKASILAKISDPWGLSYRTEYSVSGAEDVLTFRSNGPDKDAGTADDAEATSMQWPYFRETGRIIDQIVGEYPYQIWKYIRDYPTLRQVMKTKGMIPMDARSLGKSLSFYFRNDWPVLQNFGD